MKARLSHELLLVGLSHRTAPLAVREACAVDQAQLAARLRSVRALEGVREACVVSTCNRTEVLVAGELPDGLERVLRDLLFRPAEPRQVYAHPGLRAVMHTFRVAGGLDSLVLGESQVLAQVKAALEAARVEGLVGPTLDPLLRQALSFGKRVRTETEVGQGTLSVARVAVDVAHQVFGGFGGVRALVVGAGETGLLVAKHLRAEGVGELVFANRTVERAREAAESLGGLHCSLDGLPDRLARTDLVVGCVEAPEPTVTRASLSRARLERRDRPLLLVDLAVPRAIAADCAQLGGVLAYDLDDLAAVVERNRDLRERATEQTAELLVGELHKYLALQSYQLASPAIAAMRERFDAVREGLLDELAGDASSAEQVRLAHELSKRLLDVALSQLKESFRHIRSEEVLDREYQRYLDAL